MAHYFRKPPLTTDYPFVVITSDQDEVNHLEFFETQADAFEAAEMNVTPATPSMACRILKGGHDTEDARLPKITIMVTLDQAAIAVLRKVGAKNNRKGLQQVLSAMLDTQIQALKTLDKKGEL